MGISLSSQKFWQALLHIFFIHHTFNQLITKIFNRFLVNDVLLVWAEFKLSSLNKLFYAACLLVEVFKTQIRSCLSTRINLPLWAQQHAADPHRPKLWRERWSAHSGQPCPLICPSHKHTLPHTHIWSFALSSAPCTPAVMMSVDL